MTPTVLLLLSVLSVQGCQELERRTVTNLQQTISREEQKGFREVFPKNYVVPLHFNTSSQCQGQSITCCVFSKAVILSHSWAHLLQHLDGIHLKRRFVTELKYQLDDISRKSFLEIPDPSVFPSVHSSPGYLLNYTSSLLSKWLELDCPKGSNDCIFPVFFNAEDEEDDDDDDENEEVKEFDGGTEKQEEGNDANEGTGGDFLYVKEGEREKRWVTVHPANGDKTLSASPGLLLCALSSLRMTMYVMLRQL